jgi:hypothetical protein
MKMTHQTSDEQAQGVLRQAPRVPRRIDVDLTNSEASSGNGPLTRRGRIATRAAGAVLATAVAVTGVNMFRPSHNHEFTNKQLTQMEQKPITAQPGEGVDHAIERVDPQLANDPQGLSDVESYVSPQLGADHLLDQAQQLIVPVTPK